VFRAVREIIETAWHRLFRIVDGKRVDTGQQYAEVCLCPIGWPEEGWACLSYLAWEPYSRLCRGWTQLNLPFQTMDWEAADKVTGCDQPRDTGG
jgi:hypothetical protein